MATLDYKASIARGLEHVGSHADASMSVALDLIAKGQGSFSGCLRSIHQVSEAKTMIAWFRDHDLVAHKQWAYMTAKLRRMIKQLEPSSWFPAYEHLLPLLSDHPGLVSWYSQHRAPYMTRLGIKDKDNPKQPAFHGYQALLALNGQWDELRERCERILSMDLKRDRKYLIDHRFYLALAKGDKPGMESVLAELCSPKIARVRNVELAFGFTENFIATHATIYAKIAWRHGFELEIGTPWIPREWLPVQPLAHYEDPWPFMQAFDLFQPFEGEWSVYSPTAPDSDGLAA